MIAFLISFCSQKQPFLKPNYCQLVSGYPLSHIRGKVEWKLDFGPPEKSQV